MPDSTVGGGGVFKLIFSLPSAAAAAARRTPLLVGLEKSTRSFNCLQFLSKPTDPTAFDTIANCPSL